MNSPLDDEAIAKATALIRAAAAAEREEWLTEALRPASRPRALRHAKLALVALLAAAAATFVTWQAVRRTSEPAFALDGDQSPGLGTTAPTVRRDVHGRIEEIVRNSSSSPDGERLMFRSGRLIRVEHWVDGRLDGTVIDLDSRGQVVSIRVWRQGVASEPWILLDPDDAPSPGGGEERVTP